MSPASYRAAPPRVGCASCADMNSTLRCGKHLIDLRNDSPSCASRMRLWPDLASVVSMTTPPETPDPFASPTSTSSAPPAPMAPPGSAPMAPQGYVPITVAPSGSGKIALWAIILTGAYAAALVLNAVMAPALVERLKQQFADPQHASASGGQSPVSYLALLLEIASYVLLALWMSRIRAARTARGE